MQLQASLSDPTFSPTPKTAWYLTQGPVRHSIGEDSGGRTHHLVLVITAVLSPSLLLHWMWLISILIIHEKTRSLNMEQDNQAAVFC